MLGLFDYTYITYNNKCIDLILWNKSGVDITTTKSPQQKLLADWLVMNDKLTIHNQALCQKPPMKAPGASNSDPRGLFHQQPASAPKINSHKVQSQKSPLRWEPQAEIPRACPKHAFGHTYKFPAWKPHKKYELRTTQTSRGHYKALVLQALVKHLLVSRGAVHSLSTHQPGECCLVACSSTKPHSPRGHVNHAWMQQSVPIRSSCYRFAEVISKHNLLKSIQSDVIILRSNITVLYSQL